MWPTTFGAICIVVGGLTLFGGCLGLSGMDELQQLHTAIPFGSGEMDESLAASLATSGPPMWFTRTTQIITVLMALFLLIQGVFLLQRDRSAPSKLVLWSYAYITLSIATLVFQWVPRWLLVTTNSEAKGVFLAQLLIAMPMQLLLPAILIVFLNKKKVKAEIAGWR